jgi:hypothetical protein
LNIYYGSLANHYALVKFYGHVDAEDSVAIHQVADKISAAIEKQGDGSRERPYPVVSASKPKHFYA